MLPETKGRKLTDIRLLFKNYTCAYGCRVYMCCCLYRQRFVVSSQDERRSKEEIAAAKRAANKLVRAGMI
jgi:hypothetical protein